MTLPLFAYQDVAAERMASRERFGLHDEMGIGKTATTIGAVNKTFSTRGVVICPAMLRQNWIREFNKFDKYGLRLVKARSIHDYVAWMHRRFDVLVCSYEHATKWSKKFVETGEYIDFFALDEAHYLKNTGSQRTKAILGDEEGNGGIERFAQHAWHVTGTPMTKTPMDAYTFLRFCRALNLNANDFAKTFFHVSMGAYGPRYEVKEEMAFTLHQLLAANSLRRTHGDVGLELPPIWLTETVIEAEGDVMNDIALAIQDYPYIEQQIVEAIAANDIRMLDAAHIATVRRLVGKAKAAAYGPLLKSELDAGSSIKRVSFFQHTEPLLFVANYLRKYGYNPITLYGDTTESERQRAVEQYEQDPLVGPVLSNMTVGGVGLTMVAGNEADIVESSWVPAPNAQAFKRVHRIGQTRGVSGRFITLADSIDEVVNEAVRFATAEIARVDGFAMTAAPPMRAA